jgi:hypothetical protein
MFQKTKNRYNRQISSTRQKMVLFSSTLFLNAGLRWNMFTGIEGRDIPDKRA